MRASVYILGEEFYTVGSDAMKLSKKIFWIWLGGVTTFAVTLLLLPNYHGVQAAGFINYSVQFLLFILSVYLAKLEPTKKNKFIFINFGALFSLSIASHAYNFIGPGMLLFSSEAFARLYANQYVLFGAFYFLLGISIVYVSIDVLFREYKTWQKYAISFLIVGSFFGYYFHPLLTDPKFTYHTADVLDWKTLDRSAEKYREQFGADPAPAALAASTEMYTWKEGRATGVLYPEERLRRVEELYPYLTDPNYLILIYKPLYMNVIYMCMVCIGFTLLFFGYLYMKDPPQGAYIEKVMFLFLVFCSLEILHSWSYIKSVEWRSFNGVWTVGQYISIVVLLGLVLTFSVRLRFITSVKGEFYEQELAASPSAVTRWRDALDNIVIERFFNRKLILGRMFVDPGLGKPTESH